MVVNEQFYQACNDLTRTTLAFLADKPIPESSTIEVTFQADNGYQVSLDKRAPDYRRLYIAHKDEIFSLPEFDRLFKVVSETPPLASILFVDAGEQRLLEPESQKKRLSSYFDKFLTEYFKAANVLAFELPIFESIYQALEQYIYSTAPFKALWIFHLKNLVSEVEVIPLGPGIHLRQATQEEKRNAIWEAYAFHRGHFVEVPDVFLEVHDTIDRKPFPLRQIPELIAPGIILALRLLKSNPVGLFSYHWHTPDQPFRDLPSFTMWTSLQPSTYHGEKYLITSSDGNELRKLWPKAKKAISDPELSVALTRWEDSYGRTKVEDRLIDYWIALESLFLPSDGKRIQDMGETVAMVMSHYLGKTVSERNSMRNTIKRSHEARSHLIHAKREKLKYDLNEMVTKTGEYLRRALRKRIEE